MKWAIGQFPLNIEAEFWKRNIILDQIEITICIYIMS